MLSSEIDLTRINTSFRAMLFNHVQQNENAFLKPKKYLIFGLNESLMEIVQRIDDMGTLLINFPTIDCPIIISHLLPIFTLSSYQFVEKILLNLMPRLTLETLAYIKVCCVCSGKTYDFYPSCDLLIYFQYVTFLRYVGHLYLIDLQGLNLVY